VKNSKLLLVHVCFAFCLSGNSFAQSNQAFTRGSSPQGYSYSPQSNPLQPESFRWIGETLIENNDTESATLPTIAIDGTLAIDGTVHATVDGEAMVVQVDACGSGWRLFNEGGQAEALVLTPRQAELYALMPVKAAPDTSKFLLSPMPGLLASVAVSEGQEVKTGEVLAVVEAMKMENVLRATRDGTVKTLHAKAGDSLRVDQKIIEFG